MKNVRYFVAPILVLAFGLLLASAGVARAYPVDLGPDSKTQQVSDGGHGPAIVLLPGYAEDSRLWKLKTVAG